jgi:outer membrane protein assembly factor BamB
MSLRSPATSLPSTSYRQDALAVQDWGSDPLNALARSEGTVLVTCDDGKLYAIDSSSGAKSWDLPADAEIWASPVVYKGTIFFGDARRPHACMEFCRMAPRDGSANWVARSTPPRVFPESSYS